MYLTAELTCLVMDVHFLNVLIKHFRRLKCYIVRSYTEFLLCDAEYNLGWDVMAFGLGSSCITTL
jgi:hypothetical protein